MKTGGSTAVQAVTKALQKDDSARVYRLDGTHATASTSGIVIEDGQKVVRK